MIPNTTATNSRPCSANQTESVIRSACECSESLISGLLHARGRGVDRGQRFLRGSADFDISHRVDGRDVVIDPRAKNVLLFRAIAAGGERRTTQRELGIEACDRG